jgi:hypothetical protein
VIDQSLVDAIRDLDFEIVPEKTIFLEVSSLDGRDADPAETVFAVETGLFDVIAEAALARCETSAERIEQIEASLRRVQSLAAVTRFALFERLETLEQQERGARMNGLDIEMTLSWMLPRLRADIQAYTERIEALQRAIEETSR